MVRVASRELRNDTAGVLRRVTAGERVEITVRGEAVASLGPLTRDQSPWTPKDVLVAKLARVQADPGLVAELAALDAETDDLGPLE